LRYRCLILDHDDTAVDGTRLNHYPAHVRSMRILRPELTPVDLDTWFAKNFDPGITAYLVDELGLSEEEMEVEARVWREHATRSRPPFYEGFLEAVAAYQARGGAIVVASHSEEDVIRTHYSGSCNGVTVRPDLVFGWDLGPELRKPHPFAVEESIRRLGVDRHEVLVVDDLKPGVDMARAAGVDVAAAAWAHDIPMIRAFMRRHCVATFDTVAEFAAFILGEAPTRS
jgi:phosphoglycolate phosphatase/pyrophosphatase PpaX